MSKDRNQYNMFHSLLNGSHVFTLNSETLMGEVRQKAQDSLSKSKRVYILHDPSDIRKENSESLEYLGKVKSLKKTTINGYKTFNSVAVDPAQGRVDLLEHITYSTAHPDFIKEELLDLYKKEPQTPLLSAAQKEKIAQNTYINNHKLYLQTLQQTHQTLKAANKGVILTHIQDREFDGEDNFAAIDDLGDEFITRLKLNRLSNERKIVYTPKLQKISQKVDYKPLIDTVFAHKSTYLIPELKIKNKKYFKVTCQVEWDKLEIGGRSYTCVKITLFNTDNKPIFEKPMLLLTNRLILTAQDAQQVYSQRDSYGKRLFITFQNRGRF